MAGDVRSAAGEAQAVSVASPPPIQLLPAIDLLGGQAVRLLRGDYTAVTVYNDDPLAQALLFAESGARWLHVVDLDAARGQGLDNRAVIARIIAESGLAVEVGGGVRSLEAVSWLADAGAARVILGTSLVRDWPLVEAVIDGFADKACAAIDARDGKVAIAAWTEATELDAWELAAELSVAGVRHFLYTDINRDGLQTGIDVDAYRRMAKATGHPVIASGGVASLGDLSALKAAGESIEGVIVGRALYERSFSVEQALDILG
jgi:phosphoribosylformimino-5-aminoimidazole carboxamide ribotide isomerase